MVEDRLLTRAWECADGKKIRKRLFKEMHNGKTGGHMGVNFEFGQNSATFLLDELRLDEKS